MSKPNDKEVIKILRRNSKIMAKSEICCSFGLNRKVLTTFFATWAFCIYHWYLSPYMSNTRTVVTKAQTKFTVLSGNTLSNILTEIIHMFNTRSSDLAKCAYTLNQNDVGFQKVLRTSLAKYINGITEKVEDQILQTRYEYEIVNLIRNRFFGSVDKRESEFDYIDFQHEYASKRISMDLPNVKGEVKGVGLQVYKPSTPVSSQLQLPSSTEIGTEFVTVDMNPISAVSNAMATIALDAFGVGTTSCTLFAVTPEQIRACIDYDRPRQEDVTDLEQYCPLVSKHLEMKVDTIVNEFVTNVKLGGANLHQELEFELNVLGEGLLASSMITFTLFVMFMTFIRLRFCTDKKRHKDEDY